MLLVMQAADQRAEEESFRTGFRVTLPGTTDRSFNGHKPEYKAIVFISPSFFCTRPFYRMNTALSRANSLFAFSLSVMAALTFGVCVCASVCVCVYMCLCLYVSVSVCVFVGVGRF